MSEEEETTSEETPATNSMAAFSDKLTELGDALGLLYITRNSSGRNKFREKWPEVSEYLFGLTLINYDINGCDDREQRTKLEEEANDRRIMLKTTISEIVDKSVEAGSLIFDYVGEVIDQYGAEMSIFLYAEDVIERVRPGLLATRGEKPKEEIKEQEETPNDDITATTTVSEISDDLKNDSNDDISKTATIEEEKQAQESDEKLSSEEKSLLSNSEEAPEEIKPIETSIPPEVSTTTIPDLSPRQEGSDEEKPDAPIEPKQVPEKEIEVKPIETNAPQAKEETKENKPVLESEKEIVPDILKSSEEETIKTEHNSDEPEKIEELTVQQAAKAEKGVYMAMFNALAKAV